MTKQRDDDDYLGRRIKMRHPTGTEYMGRVAGLLREVGCTVVNEFDSKEIVYCTDVAGCKENDTPLDEVIDHIIYCIDNDEPFDVFDIGLKIGIYTLQDVGEMRTLADAIARSGIDGCGNSQDNLKARCKF